MNYDYPAEGVPDWASPDGNGRGAGCFTGMIPPTLGATLKYELRGKLRASR
jgi:hypothetical protein